MTQKLRTSLSRAGGFRSAREPCRGEERRRRSVSPATSLRNVALLIADVTVDPTLNSFELRNLESGTAYEVQMSGFTAAGEGVRSPATRFKTEEQGHGHQRTHGLSFVTRSKEQPHLLRVLCFFCRIFSSPWHHHHLCSCGHRADVWTRYHKKVQTPSCSQTSSL